MTAAREEPVLAAAAAIRELAGIRSGPVAEWGLVLGSGLGHVGDWLIERGGLAVPYEQIPGFPGSGVAGHAGRLVIGKHNDRAVVVLQGRSHFYEGHDIDVLTRGVRTLLELGVSRLLLTNAAGAVNPDFRPGELMLIEDHINWLPVALPGNRTAEVWDPALRGRAAKLASELGVPVRSGVYASMPGPTYETSAEVRMMGILGADAVGMSTVPEAVCAAGRARIIGISCITNAAAGLQDGPITHEEVAEIGRRVAYDFGRLVLGLIGQTD